MSSKPFDPNEDDADVVLGPDGLPALIIKDGQAFPGPVRPPGTVPTLGEHAGLVPSATPRPGSSAKPGQILCETCRFSWIIESSGALMPTPGSRGIITERWCQVQPQYLVPLEMRAVTSCNRYERLTKSPVDRHIDQIFDGVVVQVGGKS